MASQFVASITDILPVPEFFPGVSTLLAEVWSKLGLDTFDLIVEGLAESTDIPDTSETLTEEESLAFLEEYEEDSPEGEVSTDPGVPSTAPLVVAPEPVRVVTLRVLAFSDVTIALPGLDGVSFVINPGGFDVTLRLSPEEAVGTATVSAAVRFASNLLVPMTAVPGQPGQFVKDETSPFVQIDLGSIAVTVRATGEISVDVDSGISLARPAMIGNTGVIVESAEIDLSLTGTGDKPDEAPAGWKGVLLQDARIRIPSVFSGDIGVEKLGFGTGGVSGKIFVEFTPPLQTTVLGMTGALSLVSVRLRENIPIEGRIAGSVTLPFFDFPEPLDVAITISIDGTVTATLSSETGVTLSRDGFATFAITSLTVGVEHGKFFTALSGSLTPEVLDLSWPTFDIKELRIDSSGHVSIAGGWINLPSQKTFSLYAFRMEITKLGFGTEDNGDRWIGCSGGIKIVDGMSAGASVEGLRILWQSATDTPRLSLEGVGIELEIPNALSLKGKVRLTEGEFLGAVTVTLPSVGLVVEGQFVTGTLPTGQRSFAVFLHAELPAGIPLGQTDLAIYGLAGLYGQHRAPDKGPTEDWYQSLDGKPGWYLKGTPGVEDLSKWKPQLGSFAFGAGITIGTFADNGFKFSGRVLLVVVLPGPTIMIDGRANLFKKRAALAEGEPNFRAFAVLEAGKSVLINLDAHYKYKDDGELIDMNGSAEAFFNFEDAGDWHIFVGLKDDPKRRVSATAFKLFTGNGYFQLSPKKMELGSGWGFDESYGFDELNVHVFASMETAATVSWHPNHFTGSVILDGGAEVRAFGYGTGIHVHADIQGDVFDPFHLKGSFFAGIDLPWPLPDLGKTINLEWTEPVPPPRLPLPLQEASAEFNGRQLRWPFLRGENHFPNYDQGDLELAHGEGPPNADFTFGDRLVVPADSKLGLTFSRPVDDVGDVGDQSTEVVGEIIGDPQLSKAQDGYRVGYVLSRARLEKLAPVTPSEQPGSPLPAGATGIGWVPVAQSGDTGTGLPDLYGGWTLAGPPDNPENPADPEAKSVTNNAQAKLVIYAKTPLDYTAVASRDWEEWFFSADPAYPCVPVPPAQSFVAVFTLPIGTTMGAPNFYIFIEPRFDVVWASAGDICALDPPTVQGLLGPIDRGVRVAAVAPNTGVFTGPTLVRPPRGANEIGIRVARPAQLQYQPDETYGVFHSLGPISSALNGSLAITTRSGSNVIPSTVGTVGPDDEHPGVLVSSFQTLEFRPAVPALFVEMVIFGESTVSFQDPEVPPPDPGTSHVAFFDSAGTLVHVENLFTDDVDPNVVRFAHTDIARIVVNAGNGANFVTERIHVRTPVRAIAVRRDDPSTIYGPFTEVDGLITVKGINLGTISLTNACGGEFVIVELSVASRQDQRTKHTYASLARLSATDAVLEPETDYRLTVRTHREVTTQSRNAQGVEGDDPFTEKLYFQTAALPGIGVPDVPAGTQTGTPDPDMQPVTGFEDLSFYVKRTVPAVPPPAGGHNSPARAVYRAYDTNVEFSEETVYIERVYLLAKRDLTLRLFDGNNLPLLDDQGKLVLPASHWGQSPDPKIATSVQQWIGRLNTAACRPTPPFDPSQVLRSEVIDAPTEEILLAPETLHQNRLVPMLLHETFVDARPGLVADGQDFQIDRWRADNHNSPNPAQWTVQFETVVDPTTGEQIKVWYATETNQLLSSLIYDGPLASVAKTSHPDHPSQWKDFRVSFRLRWQDREVGVELRRASADDMVRLTLNRSTGVHRLVAVEAGSERELGFDDQTPFPDPGFDLIVEIECIDSRIRVFEHLVGDPLGEPVLEATTAPNIPGTVALFTSGGIAPRFGDIRVDDLRANPSTAFRFDFITSKYANFFHHLHGSDDQLFEAPQTPALVEGDLQASLPVSIGVPDTTGSPGLGLVADPEHLQFETLELKVLGADGRLRAPARVEILRATHDDNLTALLIRSPEPLLWERTLLVPKSTSQSLALGIPGDFKLASVSLGATPTDETVTVLVREPQSLSGYRLEWRPIPDTTTPDPAWSLYYQFGPESPLREGTQVRVLSCSSSEAPARLPGSMQRFVALDPTESAVHFPTAGVELRLLAPDGAVTHQRRFLSGVDFGDLEMRVVRKRDGTAFFLFFPPGVSPASGTMRLSFTFARNAGTNLPRLTQAGYDGPEGVTLDVEV